MTQVYLVRSKVKINGREFGSVVVDSSWEGVVLTSFKVDEIDLGKKSFLIVLTMFWRPVTRPVVHKGGWSSTDNMSGPWYHVVVSPLQYVRREARWQESDVLFLLPRHQLL